MNAKTPPGVSKTVFRDISNANVLFQLLAAEILLSVMTSGYECQQPLQTHWDCMAVEARKKLEELPEILPHLETEINTCFQRFTSTINQLP